MIIYIFPFYPAKYRLNQLLTKTMILAKSCNLLTFQCLSTSILSSSTFSTLSNTFSPQISRHWNPIPGNPLLGTYYNLQKRNPTKLFNSFSSSEVESNEEETDFQVVTAVRSRYNDIVIVDTADSRMLMLDSTRNVHSIFNKGDKWTSSYWDEFASLPVIIPNGPIAILGLAGGTAAHLMLDLWPSLQLEGWEIDEILINKARDYLWLSDLEKHNENGGILHVHVGDALSEATNITGGYAGIVVDMFSNGKVLPQMHELETWLKMKDKLKPNGRLMLNCGSGDNVSSISDDCTWEQNSTIRALCQAFPGEVSWKKLSKDEGDNYLALTGPLPDLSTWSAALPAQLSSNVMQWKTCSSL